MKIEGMELAALLSGIIGFKESDSGIIPERFTPEQYPAFSKSKAWEIRTRCPAGCSIQLATDSEFIEIELEIGEGSRLYFGLDLEADGVLVDSVKGESEGGSITHRFDLTGNKKNYTLYLPQTKTVEIRKLELSSNASIEQVPEKKAKLLTLGDSITQGMHAKQPSQTYTVQLAKILDMDLLNQGVGGHVYDVASLPNEFPFKPELITIAYGVNDWNKNTSKQQIAENVSAYLNRLLGLCPESLIVVLTPIWCTSGATVKEGGTLPEFSTVIAETADKFESVRVINGYSLVPNIPEYFADGGHPTDLGFMHYAINLAKEIVNHHPYESIWPEIVQGILMERFQPSF